MDLLYLIWLPEWPLHAWSDLNRVHDQILHKISKSKKTFQDDLDDWRIDTSRTGCVLENNTRNAFFKSSDFWSSSWLLHYDPLLHVYVKNNLKDVLENL